MKKWKVFLLCFISFLCGIALTVLYYNYQFQHLLN